MIKAYKRLLALIMAAAVSGSLGTVSASAENDTGAAGNDSVEVQSGTETKAAAALADSIPPNVRKMMTVLKEFGIIPDYYDYNLPLTYEVPRADFAASVARMMGKTEYGGSEVYFYDVPKNYWAFNEISNLTELGIIDGQEDKTFSPGEPISKSAAYKIILCAMGYQASAENSGGYPNGYLSLANRIKLSDGVSAGDTVTMSDMLNILYNSLTINIMEPAGSKNNSITYEVSDDETLISSYRDIFYGEGYVNGANSITVYGGTINKNDALIDSDTYNSGGIDMMQYLGEKIEFFYEDHDSSDDKKLLWVGQKKSSQTIKYISVDGDAELDTDTFTYTYYDENDRKRRVNLDRSILVVYNGGIVDSGYDKLLNDKRYDMKLLSDGGKYTVMVIRAYENFVAGNINSIEQIVYDKNKTQEYIDLNKDNYDTFSIRMMGNEEISFEDITKDTVLSVYRSKDKRHIEVYASHNIVDGAVESINDTDKKEVTINGRKYRVDDKVSLNSFSIGDNVTAYTDVYGEIAYISTKAGDFKGSFLLKAFLDEQEENMVIKQLGEDSNVTKLNCVEKLTIDGIRYKTAKDAYRMLLAGENKLTAQFALIKTNENGEITEIDTTNYNPAKETQNSLQVDVPFWYGKETTYTQRLIRANANAARIGEKIVFDADTKVFVVPFVTDYSSVVDDDFWVTVGSKLKNDTGTYAESYKVTESSGIAKYILLKGYDPNRVSGELPILAQRISYGVNDDGDRVEVLEGYQGAAPVSIMADESVDDLFSRSGVMSGDVVTLSKDTYGNVKGCTVAYDYRSDEHKALSALNDYQGMFVGYANDVVDTVVKIGFESGATYDFAINAMSRPVLVYDRSKNKNNITIATLGDIITYKNDPENCSTVFIATNRMQPQMFIIYK